MASRPRSIDLRTIRPMDPPTVIEWVKKTGRLRHRRGRLSAVGRRHGDRHPRHGARPSTISTRPILTIAGKDVPMPYAANLEKLALPNVGEVVDAVKAVCYK